jgi:hypothetical protein
MLLQLETPDDMRGRVNAVNSLFIGTPSQLGGAGTLLVVVLWMRWFPSLVQRDTLEARPG